MLTHTNVKYFVRVVVADLIFHECHTSNGV